MDSTPSAQDAFLSGQIQAGFLPNKIIYIEGNIGSGKSTVIKKLQKEYQDMARVIVLEEDVKAWTSVKIDDKSILQLFYEDMKRHALAFDLTILHERYQTLQRTIDKLCIQKDGDCKQARLTPRDRSTSLQPEPFVLIIERSPQAGREVFVQNGLMSEFEKLAYFKSADACEKLLYIPSSTRIMYVYIDTPVDLCAERIHKRQRTGQTSIPREYLEILHISYTAFNAKYGSVLVDGSQTEDAVYSDILALLA